MQLVLKIKNKKTHQKKAFFFFFGFFLKIKQNSLFQSVEANIQSI